MNEGYYRDSNSVPIMSLDSAISTNSRHAFTVIGAFEKDGRRYLWVLTVGRPNEWDIYGGEVLKETGDVYDFPIDRLGSWDGYFQVLSKTLPQQALGSN